MAIVSDIIKRGTRAAQPAATAVGAGTLYFVTDELLVERSTGSAWETYSAGSAPAWLRALMGVTATNDYYWDGNDLAGFTEVDITGTTTWTEGNNLVSCLAAGMTADDWNTVLIAKTFSIGDEWEVTLLGCLGHTNEAGVALASMFGLVFTDGTISTSNVVIGHIQISLSTGDLPQSLLVGRSGTLTSATTAPWVLDDNIPLMPFQRLHIRLKYSAANTFQLRFSPDGVTFHAYGEADISKTMTPTHVGLGVVSSQTDGWIFTFGPLRKVA